MTITAAAVAIPSWQEYGMGFARQAATRSRCTRAQVGAAILDQEHILVATGYNAPPRGLDIVCSMGCPRSRQRLTAPDDAYADCISLHAEANALMFSDRRLRAGGTIYITHAPCWGCAKLIANSGLAHVVFATDDLASHRRPEKVRQFLTSCGLTVETV